MNAGALSPQVLRGLQLKNLGRYTDAEKAFREALGENPRDAFALHHLAVCQLHQPERQTEALATIREAIAIEPREADHFGVEAFILCALRRPKEALTSVRTALEIDPYSSFAFTAQGQAHLQLEQWAEAEGSARQALLLDADNSVAANQLAQALRLQNKLAENAEHLAGMLARDPGDAFTHANAGWSALQRGRRREAETHFLEALRLDPDLDYAREGLLNSFRARSAFYRTYLRYCFWMQRLSKRSRWAVVLGFYFAVQVGRQLFTGRYRGVAIGLSVLYFTFVLWVWIAKGVGNFILLFDSFARHALRRNEKIEAIAVGGGFCCGVLLCGAGFAANQLSLLAIGAALVAAAFPFSLTFTNESRKGAWLFGSVGALALAGGLLLLVQSIWPVVPEDLAINLFMIGLVGCLACTWLGNIPALRRR